MRPFVWRVLKMTKVAANNKQKTMKLPDQDQDPLMLYSARLPHTEEVPSSLALNARHLSNVIGPVGTTCVIVVAYIL